MNPTTNPLEAYLNVWGKDGLPPGVTWANTAFGVARSGCGKGDYLFLDYLFYSFPQLRLAVELGTFRGLTTLWLGVAMQLRGGHVTTFDIADVRDADIVAAWPANITFRREDVLADNPNVVGQFGLVGPPGVLLFCDNGDKVREVALYARHLRSGSVLLVHDWETEVPPAAVAPFLTEFTPFQHDFAALLQSHLRAWVRR